MKLLATLAICAVMVCAAPAAAQNVDITGTWDVLVLTQQGDVPSVLTLKKEGEKFVGTISSQMGEAAVEAATKEKAVSIYFSLQSPNGNLDVVFNGTVDGDSMKGTAEVAQMGQMEWSAKRQPGTGPGASPAPAGVPPAPSAVDVTGTWGLEVTVDGTSGTPTLVLKQDGEKLTGQYQSTQFGTVQVVGSIKGSAISFNFDVTAQGNALHAVFSGTVEKDTMKGSVDFGGVTSGSFTGKKR